MVQTVATSSWGSMVTLIAAGMVYRTLSPSPVVGGGGGVVTSSTGVNTGSPLMVAFSNSGGMKGGEGAMGGAAGTTENPVIVAFSITLVPFKRICIAEEKLNKVQSS